MDKSRGGGEEGHSAGLMIVERSTVLFHRLVDVTGVVFPGETSSSLLCHLHQRPPVLPSFHTLVILRFNLPSEVMGEEHGRHGQE
jgi:hypothetical protein